MFVRKFCPSETDLLSTRIQLLLPLPCCWISTRATHPLPPPTQISTA